MHHGAVVVGLALSLVSLVQGCGSEIREDGVPPVCDSNPVALTGDELDPDEVYLAGTLVEGSCGEGALAHWKFPDMAAAGFDCYFDVATAQIRPTDQRLLYTNTFEGLVREFHCDDCPFSGSYPADPLANDTVLSSAPCASDEFGLWGFLVSPEGEVLQHCSSDASSWYDSKGKLVYADSQHYLLHLGYGDLALAQGGIVHLDSGVLSPFVGLPERPMITVRARAPNTFLVVLQGDQAASDGSAELWEVDAEGGAQRLGVYPPPPEGGISAGYSSSLEACGALLQLGPTGANDIIQRREVSGASEIVYDEATNPLVKSHGSALVTGP